MKLIEALFLAYLVLFPFGQLTRVPLQIFESPEARFYLADIVLFFLLFSWGIWRFLLVKKKYQLPPLAIPIFSFSIICLLSLGLGSPLLSNREVLVAGLYLVRWLVYAGLYFVVADIKDYFKWSKPSNLQNFLIIIGVAIALFGLVQYFLWPDLKPLKMLEWDPHYYRLVGTFLDPGFTGMLLALTLVLVAISYINISSSHWRDKRWLFLSSLITYVALALTYSRASYLAYLTGIGVISFVKKLPKLFIGVVLIGVLTLMILPRPAGEGGKLERTYSIEARIRDWQQSITIVRDHPLLGVGFNVYRYAQRDYGFLKDKWQVSHAGAGADSSILFVLATTGILGASFYLWLWWKTLKSHNLAVIASVLALLAHSLFNNSLFYPWLMAWMWILLGSFSTRRT